MNRLRVQYLAIAVFVFAAPIAAAPRTELIWDTYGVPHIFAGDDRGAFRALGWAQAQSHGDLLLRLYAQGRGRAAEYYGEQYLASDKWVRTNGIPARGAAWFEKQSPVFKANIAAFADGINSWAAEHPSALLEESRRVLPIESADVFAHINRILHFTFVIDERRVSGAQESARSALQNRAAAAMRLNEEVEAPGSNMWAISPKRSASRHTMLLQNPHLPWQDLYTFYEAHIKTSTMNLYGTMLIGQPGMSIAFNDHMGWSHTVNPIDAADLYALTPAPGGYMWDGAVRPFEESTETIKIRLKNGTLREEPLVIRRSIHGPVVTERDGKPIALRVAGLDDYGIVEQYWDMSHAKNLKQFESAVKRLQIPMFNIMYADRKHIYYLFGGNIPIRPAGAYNWSGIVPGDTAKTLWTETHPYKDLPRVVNPPSGWLQNSNDPPWSVTYPAQLDANKFPSYVAPRAVGFRPQRGLRMISETDQMTFDQLIELKHSTRMELADRVLPDLLTAARGKTQVAEAVALLEKWDRTADNASRGGVLFSEWVRQYQRAGYATMFATPWTESDPRGTPKGLADPAKAVAFLEAAMAETKRKYGRLDVAWGDAHRLRLGGLDLAGNGDAGDPLGIFRVINYAQAPDGKQTATGGDSYVGAIDFGRRVKAMVVMSYGNASQSGSPHLTDQLDLISKKKMRPVWRTREEVERHRASKQTF